MCVVTSYLRLYGFINFISPIGWAIFTVSWLFLKHRLETKALGLSSSDLAAHLILSDILWSKLILSLLPKRVAVLWIRIAKKGYLWGHHLIICPVYGKDGCYGMSAYIELRELEWHMAKTHRTTMDDCKLESLTCFGNLSQTRSKPRIFWLYFWTICTTCTLISAVIVKSSYEIIFSNQKDLFLPRWTTRDILGLCLPIIIFSFLEGLCLGITISSYLSDRYQS